jgi:hypothetical protein
MRSYFNLSRKLFVQLLVVAFISGCAKPAENIKPADISPLQYQYYSCDQIGQEMSEVGRKAAEISGVQDSVAKKDIAVMTVGLVIFWPSLFFLAAGEDQKNEIARLKGESEALEQAAIKKQCTVLLAQLEEARKLQNEQ